jgi:hypothetical protein
VSGTGKLTVKLASPDPYVRQPVNVIDAKTLQLVASPACDEEIELPEGTYLVSAVQPSGQRSVGAVEVAPDQAAELELGTAEPAPGQAAAPAAPVPPPAAAPPPAGELEGLGPPAGADAAPAKSGWFVRFHVQMQSGFAPATPSFDTAHTESGLELAVQASGDGILFAQVAREGEIPLVVALPVYGPTSSQSCRLTLGTATGTHAADVSLPDNPQVDAVARYLQGGLLQEAAGVIENAETLLQQKMADPFGAALGGYALIRSGQLDRLHHWPQNLANNFPYLADGAVIAAEELALEGDHAGALGFVCDAARRGLPVFGAGFSLLASRLREYAGAPATAFGDNGPLVEEAGQHLERILRYMPFVDFARVSFAFRGGRVDDPAESQKALIPTEDGWQEL